ncbi:hypothetical protein PanWU01x14_255250 [Parasponia andersonii]|uniref:Uncharacterized protein n=1 Tax=Parasponia andersonii TaxID=3476 RepID=A0A2P5BAX5_PARAD|nr:hypothetical protein PanWU01x14_255250 [Parasponia andersonii]
MLHLMLSYSVVLIPSSNPLCRLSDIFNIIVDGPDIKATRVCIILRSGHRVVLMRQGRLIVRHGSRLIIGGGGGGGGGGRKGSSSLAEEKNGQYG